MKKIILLAIVLIIICACAPVTPKEVDSMREFKTPPLEPYPKEQNPGSLFNPQTSYNIFADKRARRVGDIVFVKILENATAESKAETKADKTGENSFSVGAFFGKNKVLGLPIPVGGDSVLSTKTKNKFDNDTSTSRELTVTATVAARVVNILPNGLMEIRGVREIKINNENQIIVVKGYIRSIDIDADNSITSDKIADAHIKLIGKGVVAEKQKPGWLTRILDYVWPF